MLGWCVTILFASTYWNILTRAGYEKKKEKKKNWTTHVARKSRPRKTLNVAELLLTILIPTRDRLSEGEGCHAARQAGYTRQLVLVCHMRACSVVQGVQPSPKIPTLRVQSCTAVLLAKKPTKPTPTTNKKRTPVGKKSWVTTSVHGILPSTPGRHRFA